MHLRTRWRQTEFLLLLTLCVFLLSKQGFAQENYEIQVFRSEIQEPGVTKIEAQTNFTVQGKRAAEGSIYTEEGVYPSEHALHETLEIAHGFTPWFEGAFYVLSSITPTDNWQWVGDHVRGELHIPERYHLPVGVSLSGDVGYRRAAFSPDTWNGELRPIVDKQMGRWYVSFNPVFERAWHGPGVKKGVEFSPNAKVNFTAVRWGHLEKDKPKSLSVGLEYYSELGPVNNFETGHEQRHDFFPTFDLDVSPKWEINVGAGFGATGTTDHLIVKTIIARRFEFGHRKAHMGKEED